MRPGVICVAILIPLLLLFLPQDILITLYKMLGFILYGLMQRIRIASLEQNDNHDNEILSFFYYQPSSFDIIDKYFVIPSGANLVRDKICPGVCFSAICMAIFRVYDEYNRVSLNYHRVFVPYLRTVSFRNISYHSHFTMQSGNAQDYPTSKNPEVVLCHFFY